MAFALTYYIKHPTCCGESLHLHKSLTPDFIKTSRNWFFSTPCEYKHWSAFCLCCVFAAKAQYLVKVLRIHEDLNATCACNSMRHATYATTHRNENRHVSRYLRVGVSEVSAKLLHCFWCNPAQNLLFISTTKSIQKTYISIVIYYIYCGTSIRKFQFLKILSYSD